MVDPRRITRRIRQKLIQDNRVYVTWDSLDVDLAKLTARPQLVTVITERYTDTKHKAILNWVSQVWPLAHEMKKGDLVLLAPGRVDRRGRAAPLRRTLQETNA